jgi:hypothetical protein
MRFLILLLVCLVSNSLNSQVVGNSHGIDASIGQMHSGKNLRLGYLVQKNKSRFVIGTKFHLNNPDNQDSRNYAYQYRFHAYRPIEHFGLYSNFQARLIRSKQNWSCWLRFDAEMGRLGINSVYYEKAYIPEVEGPFTWTTPQSEVIHDTIYPSYPLSRRFEQKQLNLTHVQISISLLLEVSLTEQMKLNIATGVGTSLVHVPFQINYDSFNNVDTWSFEGLYWDPFNPYLRLGFSYNFKKKEKTKTATES